MKQFYLTKKIYSVVTTVLALLGFKEGTVGTSSATRTSAINFNARNSFGIYSFKAALAFLLFASFGAFAQTTIISGTGAGSFEGASFAADGWTTVQGTAAANNNFLLGNAATIGFTPTDGTKGVCVTTNGTSRGYNTGAASWAWIYRDVTLPAGEVNASLKMDMVGNPGDLGFDGIVVGISDTSFTASISTGATGTFSGTLITGMTIATTATSNTFIEDGNYATATNRTFTFPASSLGNALSSVTKRIWIGWRCDGSVGNPTTPMSFDKVVMTTAAVTGGTAVQGGLWSSAATWGGTVPAAGGDVVIPAGMIVTVDQVVTTKNLTIGGTLQWNGSSNALNVLGNLTVNSGGNLLPYTTGQTGQTLNIGGDFQNNGYANLSLAALNFNNAGSTLSGTGTFQGDGIKGIIRTLSYQNTGSNSINTSNNLIVTSGFNHTAGSLNTNGKVTFDNTAQVYGQNFNTSVASVAVTAMGSTYNATPVVFGTAVTQWTSGGTSAVGTRYVSGGNVYIGTSTAGLGTTAPTHTSGVGGTNSNLLWLASTGTLGTPYPFNAASTVGTQYFYGGNLYVATLANAAAANNAAGVPVHTSGIVNGYLYIGSPATATVNYDATTQTVRSLNLTGGGSGYSSSPSIAFSVGVAGGTGSGAAASSVVFQQIAGPASFLVQKSGGAATISGGLTINSDAGAGVLAPSNEQASSGVGNISVSNGGVNYTAAPQVAFAGPTALNLIQNPGSGYTTTPTITVTGGTLVTGSAYTSSSFSITVNAGVVQAVYLTATTAVYSVPPTLTMSAPSSGTTATLAFPTGCWPSATPIIGGNGQIVNFTMNGSGYGYVTAPAVAVGTTSGTTAGGTFTTVASTFSSRVALYNLTTSNFTPSPAPVAQGEDAVIPANRKINTLSLGGFSAGVNLTNNLILFGTSPLSLTSSSNAPGSVINMGGNNLLFTWNGYAGASATFSATGGANAYIKNGSMTVTGRGGASTFNFPFSGTVTWFAGSTPTANSTGSSVTRVTVRDTAAPTNASQGTSFPIGSRAFRIQYSTLGNGFSVPATTGLNPTVLMTFNNDDALTAYTQDQLLISDSNSLSGPWSFKSASSGSGAIINTTASPRTTATVAPGPIVPTGDNYYAWSVSAPSITNFSPLTLCANSGTFTITGTNLTGVTNLRIGGTPVTSFTVVSATQITGVAGNGTDGFVSLQKSGNTITGVQSITVTPSPSAPSVSPTSASIVMGGSPNITASGGAGTFNWFTTATGGSPVFTGPTYTLPVCSTTTLYVAENNGSCDGPRTAVVVTVQATAITASTPTFCGSGGVTTLNVTPVDPSITYTWTSISGAALDTTSGPTVNATIVASSDFQVNGTSAAGGCTSTASISISVYPLPNATVTTTASGVCPGTSATINSGLAAGNFTASCITAPSALQTPPGTAVTLINAGTTSVALTSGNNDDGYWNGLPIGFSFNYFGTSYTSVNIGTNGTVNFGATGSTQFNFAGPPAGFPSTANPANTIAVCARDMILVSGSIKYWTEGIAPNRKFIVQYAHCPGYVTTGTGTGDNSVELVLYETTGVADIRAYSALNGTGGTVNAITKYIGLQNGTQTIGATAPNCSTNAANYWNGVTAEITTPQAWRFQPPANYTVTWSSVGPGNTLTTIQTGTNVFSLAVSPSVTTTYDLRYTNQTTGCTNIADSDRVTMDIISATAPSTTAVSNVASICLNGSANLSLTGNVNNIGNTDGLTYQWQQDTGSGYTNYTGTGNTTSAITVTPAVATTYRCLVTACSGTPVPSTPVSLNFTNLVDTTAGGTRCGTGTVSLSATTSSAGASLKWYAAASGGTALFTGSPYVPTVSSTTTFYVAAETTGPACSSPRVAVTATVTTPPTINLTGGNSALICSGGSPANLTTDADLNYDTFAFSPNNGTGSYTGGGAFTFNPTVTTVYTVTASQSGGSQCATTFTYTVNVNSTNVQASSSLPTICLGQSVNLLATSLAGGSSSLPGTYCTADSSGGGGSTPIQTVSINTLSTTTGTPVSPYTVTHPATGAETTTLTAGQTYPLAVTTNGATISSVWFDWDRSGTYEDSEWTQLWTSAASGTINVTVPANAQPGATGMRIRSRGTGNTNGAADDCTAFFSGTSEDFTVSIIANNTTANSYAWSIGATPIGTGASLTYTPTTLGPTTYTVVATHNTNGCTATATTVVTTQNSGPSITTPPASQTRCIGSTATFNVVAAGVNLTYQWRKGTTNLTNGGTISGATTATLTITGLVAGDAGDYNVVIGSDCGSPATSSDATLTLVTPSAGIHASATTVCSGTSVTLSENAGTATSWSWAPGGATTQSITVTPAATTTYTVTATTQVSGCTATASVTVNVNETPSAISVVPVTSPVCAGATAQVNATGGSFTTTYFADSFDALSSSFTAATIVGTSNTTATLNTTYQAQGSGSVLFNTDADSVEGTYSLNSNVNLSGATTASLTFSHIADMEGPTTSFDYGYVEYSSDGGTTWTTFQSANYSGAGSSAVFNGNDVRFSTRSYSDWISTFTGTGINPTNALWKNETFTIPAAAITSQFKLRFRYTKDSSASYVGWFIDNVKISANGNTQYAWTTTPAVSLYKDAALTQAYVVGTDFAPTVYAQPTAATQFTATVANGPCSNASSATVNVNPLPVITLANSVTVCKGTGTTITIPENNNNYSWAPSTGVTVINTQQFLVNPTATTTYTVTTTNTSNFCQSTNQITVNVNDPGTIVTQPADRAVAQGFSTSFTVAGSVGITYGYQWQIKTGPSTYSNLSNSAQYSGVTTATLTVDNAGTGTAVDNAAYRVLLTPPSPCSVIASNDAILTVSNTGIATNPANVNICLPTPSTAQFSVVTNGDDPYLVEWQVSTDNGVNYTTIPLIDVNDTFLYIGPDTTTVPGLTFEHPIDAGNPNGTGSEFKVLNVSGITNPMSLKFKAIVNEVLPSAVATLAVNNPVTFATNLSTTPVIRCKNPASATATTLAITTTGDVTNVEWRYDTTPGGSFTNVVANNTPAGTTYVTSAVGNNYSLDVTTNSSTPAGSYYYKAFVTGTASCGLTPSQSNMATITVNNPTVAIASSAASYCSPGSAVTLTASGASTYSWTSVPAGFTSTLNGVSVTPTVATQYNVVGTDANGCTNTASANVGVGSSFTLAATATPNVVCPNAAVALSAVPTQAGGSTYLINTVPYQFNAVSGTFTALSGTTVSSGLTTDDDTMSGTLTPSPAFTFNYGGTSYNNFRVSSNGQLVFGGAGTQSAANDLATTTTTNRGLAPLWDDQQLTVGINYQVSGTAPNRVLTVEWLNLEWNYQSNTAVISYQVKLYETTNVIEYVYRQESTAYNAGTTGGGSIGLMGTAAANFISLQDTSTNPVISTTTSKNDITSKPATGQIYRFTPVAPITYTYAWTSTPSGFTSSSATPTTNPAVNTAYNVTATSSQGCTASNSASVTVNSAAPVVNALPATQSICAGATATFTVTATSATPLTYQWKKDGSPLTNGSGISGATTATLTITGATAANNGSYTVDVTNCTTVTSTATVLTVNPIPTATVAGTTNTCQNDVAPLITFTGATGTAPYTFTYTLTGVTGNQTVTTTSGSSATLNASTATTGAFVYTLVSVSDATTCSQSQTGSATVRVNALPAAPTLTPVQTVCAGNTLVFGASAIAPVPGVSLYTVATSSGTYTPITGGTVVATGAWDDSGPAIAAPIGFSYTFNGVAYTTCNVNLNGYVSFGTTTSTTNYTPLSTLTTNEVGIISGFGRDLQGVTSTGEVRYLSTATEFIVQWSNARRYNSTTTNAESFNFQIHLVKNTNQAYIVYGAFSNAISAASAVLPQVGLRGSAVTDFKNLEVLSTGNWNTPTAGTSNTATAYYNQATVGVKPASGLTYTFTPPSGTYAWTGPNGFSSALQNPTIPNATVAATGTYTLQITNGNGCKASSTVSATVTAQPQWFLDADGDHYYTGTAVVSCTSPGAGYTTAGLLGGGDCNDSVAAINPGVTEICFNNIDDNCNGTMSETCAPVVVNMTPSYNNTTLPSLSTAIPAVAYTYPGATNLKYRFKITNITAVPALPPVEVIQTSRYVTIPASIHSYNAQYTLTVSAVINDEVVPYAGNTITVNSPVVQLITLNSASCGATLAALTSTLTANQGLNATGYTFRIRVNDANPSPTYAYSQSSTRFVSANSFTGFPLAYGASYKVAVQFTFNDPVTNLPVDSGYGAECTVNTPAIPVTTMASPTCGSQVTAMNANISAAAASYATSYQFRLRLWADNGPTPTYNTSVANASRFSSLTAFNGQGPITLAYNTEYAISVRYSVQNGATTEWSAWGPDCKVKTPFFPVTSLVPSQCGLTTATSLTQQLNITPYPGFPNYKVKLDEVSGEDIVNSQEIVVTYSYFRLNQFSIAQLGKNYNVSVAIKLNGVFGPYDTACDLFTPAPAKTITAVPFKATAYPNPFANNFMLDVKSSSQSNVNIKVYDMIGRLIEQKDVRVSDMGTTTIGTNYPSGVYNVVVSQEDTVQTVRVVKR